MITRHCNPIPLSSAVYFGFRLLQNTFYVIFLIKSGKVRMVSIMAVIIGIFYTWIYMDSDCKLLLCWDLFPTLLWKWGKYKSSAWIFGFVIFSGGMLGHWCGWWQRPYYGSVREAVWEIVMEVTKFMPPWMGFVALVCIIISS